MSHNTLVTDIQLGMILVQTKRSAVVERDVLRNITMAARHLTNNDMIFAFT